MSLKIPKLGEVRPTPISTEQITSAMKKDRARQRDAYESELVSRQMWQKWAGKKCGSWDEHVQPK